MAFVPPCLYDRRAMRKGLFVLGTVAGAAYVLVGIIVGAVPSVWEDTETGGRVAWIILLTGGGALVLLGLRIFDRAPRAGAALVSIGALVGGLILVWSVVAPIAAIVLIALSIASARRPPTQTLA
jgi:hypothetical protein